MGNQKQIANSEEKKSREGHRLLPGCQRGLSNAASGGDRRYLVRQTTPPTSADTTCPNTQETAGRTALAAPPLSANLEHKLNRSSLESHIGVYHSIVLSWQITKKRKKANHRFYLKTQNQ